MTTNRRAAEVLLLAAVVLLGLWVVAIRPAHQDADRLDVELAEARDRNAQTATRVAALHEARRRAPQERRALRRLAVALPASGGVADLVRELDAAAGRSRVRLEGVELDPGAAPATPGSKLPPGAVVRSPPPPGVPFTFTYSGSYFGLADLVHRLHGAVRAGDRTVRVRGRLVSVDAVTLLLDDADAARGAVEAKLDAVAHVAPEATP